MSNNFNDINYLTGRRMQRNHINAITNDRERHLKKSLKRFKKDDPNRDDANQYSKVLQGKVFNPLRPSNKPRRVTVEPDLDIFGNELNKQRFKLGIFSHSKCGLPFDLAAKSKQSKPKNSTTNPVIEHNQVCAHPSRFSVRDHIKVDPLAENAQKLYQLISPGTYESIKKKLDSSSFLFKFDEPPQIW